MAPAGREGSPGCLFLIGWQSGPFPSLPGEWAQTFLKSSLRRRPSPWAPPTGPIPHRGAGLSLGAGLSPVRSWESIRGRER